MVRNKQRSCVVRIDELTHLRLKAVAEIEDRDMSAVVERVLLAHMRAEHPTVISSITHVPAPSAPSSEPKQPGGQKAKPTRKPRSK